jgi:hypothetical protein
VAYAWKNAHAGDVVFFRAGEYVISGKVAGAHNGNIIYKPYNNESVTWSATFGDTVFEVAASYITIDGINLSWMAGSVGGDDAFFDVGEFGTATHFTMKNLVGVTNVAGDNTGFLVAKTGASSRYFTVENCRFTGAGADGGNHNSTAIMSFRTRDFTIRNNTINNFYVGMHLNKHSNADGTGGLVENNYIYDCHLSISTCTVDTIFRNNIIAGGFLNTSWDGGSGDSSGNDHTGSDRNTYVHNTFKRGFRFFYLDNDAGDNNNFQNNIFEGEGQFWPYEDTPPANTNTLDYNLYPAGNVVFEGRDHYNLSAWQTHHGQDSHSLASAPIYTGGAIPTTPAGYALTAASVGYQAGSDGTDMGVNAALVGADIIIPSDTTPPTLTSITPISTPTTDTTPDYTFNSNEAGTITYEGACSSSTTSAVNGNNTITLNTLVAGTYSNCTITVTDSSSNTSSILSIPSFEITAVSSTGNECDNWQTNHPDWIFCDDFETIDPLVATGRYFQYNSDEGDFAPSDGYGFDNSKGMRAIWQNGEVDAGNLALGFGRNPNGAMNNGIRTTEDFRDIYYRVYMKLEDGWQGNPAKLSRATIIAASDWSQAMIAHVWGSNTEGTLAIDPVRCVDESNNYKCVGYNDFTHMDWIGKQTGSTQLFGAAVDDQWHYIEAHVKLNDAGQSNGIHEFWIDGQLETRSDSLNFVREYDEYGINAIFFENYWNTGSTQEQERYFDNIVVSTQRIGAIVQEEIIRADVDQNSTINSTDAFLTLRNSLGLNMSSTNWQASATTGDVNCDGNTNSTDAFLTLRSSLGLNMGGMDWCIN